MAMKPSRPLRQAMLGGCTALVLNLTAAGIAQAQLLTPGVLVEDVATELGVSEQFIQDLKDAAVQLQQYATQLQQLATEVETLNNIVTLVINFVHDPTIGDALGLINALGLGQSLGVDSGTLLALFSGYGGLNSLAGILAGLGAGLGSLANMAYTSDHIYSCTDGSFMCSLSQSVATQNAGAKGAQMQIQQDLQMHLQTLQALQTQLLTTSDPKTDLDLQALIQIELVWTTNEAAQATLATGMAEAQNKTNAQAWSEKLKMDGNAFWGTASAE